MRKLQTRSFYPLCALLVLLVVTHAYGIEASSAGEILPDGLIVEKVFKPGIGLPVGKIQLVQGEAIVIHAGQMKGYLAKKDLPLYKGDTIITKEKGRIRISLNDDSVMTLASQTKLKITQSVYEPTKKIRSSFINMAIGKARFWAKKFTNFKQSIFNVKTQTAVVGVRGSEWVEEVTESSTRVTALENTLLEVVSTAAPEVEPTVVEDFQQTVIDAGELPSDVVEVSIEEIEQLKKEFTVTPEGEADGAKVEVQKKEEKKGVAAKEGTEEKATAENEAEAEEGTTGVPAGLEAADEVLVSEDALVDPDPIITEELGAGFDLDTAVEVFETTVVVEGIEDTNDEVIEEAPPEPPPETEGSITINW